MRLTDFKNHIVYFYTAYTGNLVKICIAIVETFLSVYFSLPATILKRQVSDRLVLALLISSTIPFLSVSFSLPPDTPSWRRPTIRHTVLSNTTLYLAFLSTQMFSMSHQHFLPISSLTLSGQAKGTTRSSQIYALFCNVMPCLCRVSFLDFHALLSTCLVYTRSSSLCSALLSCASGPWLCPLHPPVRNCWSPLSATSMSYVCLLARF